MDGFLDKKCIEHLTQKRMTFYIMTGWWFRTFYHPSIDFHIFQRGGSTTNQMMILKVDNMADTTRGVGFYPVSDSNSQELVQAEKMGGQKLIDLMEVLSSREDNWIIF